MSEERLQKILSRAGILSRRHAEIAITEGRVTVNGTVVRELGAKADPERDQILFDGNPVSIATRRTLVFLHKPRNVVTTKSDPEGRRTVLELLPEALQHLNPVGRLDFESEGLLLLTDDGDLLLKLTHPRYEQKKIYEVWVERAVQKADLEKFHAEVALEDGPGKFESVEILPEMATHLLITVSEGRNRFVRRMCAALGFPVVRLIRREMGPFQLGNLGAGKWRQATTEELVIANKIKATEPA